MGGRLRLCPHCNGHGSHRASRTRVRSRGRRRAHPPHPRPRRAPPSDRARATAPRVTRHLGQIGRVIAIVARNPELRREEIAFFFFNGAEWAVWIAMLVYAYDRGGATMAGLVALIQLVPATLFAPFASMLGDRYRPALVLGLSYVAQGIAMASTAAILIQGGPAWLAYAGATVAATAVTVTRPTMAALTPALARRPEELTAANVIAGWNESVSVLIAPAIGGVILGVSGPGAVFAVMGALVLAGAVVVAPVTGPPPNPQQADRPFAAVAEGF